MAAVDLSALSTDVHQVLRPIISAFTDGIDCDVTIKYGNKLILEDSGGNDVEIYVSGTSLVIPATSSSTRADTVAFYFGSDSDINMVFDGTKFTILTPVADDVEIEWGDGTKSFDHQFFFASASDYIYFDASANMVTFDGVDLTLNDGDILIFGDGADASLRWDGTDLDLLAVADDQVFKIGNGTESWDVWILGNTANDNIIFDASGNILNFDGVDIMMEDDDIISFGDSKDVTMAWAAGGGMYVLAAADNTVWTWGATGNSFDMIWYGSTSAVTMTIDTSANTLAFNGMDVHIYDADLLDFGDSQDILFTWTGTKFTMMPSTDDYEWEIGDGTTCLDIQWFGNTASNYVYFDASADVIYFEAVDLRLNDADKLIFGDSSDVIIQWDGTNMIVEAAADDSVIEIGDAAATQKSFDLKIYGQAANGADYFLFDASASTLSWAGAASLSLGTHTMAKITNKTADYTVVAADTGTFFTNAGDADDIEYTLPALAAGLHFWFSQQTDNELKVTSPEGNNIVSRNDATATSVAYTTAGEQIGGWLEFICDGTSWYYIAHTGGTGAEFTITVA